MVQYKIKGERFVRKYTADQKTPTYAAGADAIRVAESLCNVAWSSVSKSIVATFPAHSGNAATDQDNVANRDWFDAALFCSEHSNSMHRALANGACYRFTLPDSAIGVSFSELKARIFSDPYNAYGARVSVYTSSSPELPMACATCRKGSSDDESALAQANNGTETTPATEWYSTNTHVEGVAPRRSDDTSWFTNSGAAFVRPAGGLALQKYLFVFVLLERYDVARNGYLEGSSYADPTFDLTLSTAVQGLVEGEINDLCHDKGRLEVRNYDGTVKCGYQVIGRVGSGQPIMSGRGMMVGFVFFDSKTPDDCGIVNGLVVVSLDTDRAGVELGHAVKLYNPNGVIFNIVNPISIGVYLTVPYGLRIAWVDHGGWISMIRGIVWDSVEHRWDATNAVVEKQMRLIEDVESVSFVVNRYDIGLIGIMKTGGVLKVTYVTDDHNGEEAGTCVKTIYAIENGEAKTTCVEFSGRRNLVVGLFGDGDSDEGIECVNLPLDSYSGLKMSSVRDDYGYDVFGFLVCGDFKRIGDLDHEGLAIYDNGKIFPLANERFWVLPTAVKTNGVNGVKLAGIALADC